MSRLVAEEMRRMRRRDNEQERGVMVARGGFRYTSSRFAEVASVNITMLPCQLSNTQMQDEDGNFLYDPDYSDPDGPDIGAPGP